MPSFVTGWPKFERVSHEGTAPEFPEKFGIGRGTESFSNAKSPEEPFDNEELPVSSKE